MSKRDYVEEILAKQSRLHKRGNRLDIFSRRIHPLVKGFREIKSFDKNISWRSEWLKYGAIGYIACVEGYFRMLIADLINAGDPFMPRIGELKDIRFNADTVVALQTRKVSLGEYVAHLLPMNGVSDIGAHLSALLSVDYLSYYSNQPLSSFNTTPIGEIFPNTIGELESLFKLRHLYAHELATKERVPVRKIENLIGSAAMFVINTEEIVVNTWLHDTHTIFESIASKVSISQ